MSIKSFKLSPITSTKNKSISFDAEISPNYDIVRSLRFRRSANAKLTRTMSSTWTDKKKWTISFWNKRSKFQDATGDGIMWYYSGGSGGGINFVGSGSGAPVADDSLSITNRNATGGAGDYAINTAGLHRDPAVWNHFVINMDSTHAAQGERVKIYLNGIRITEFTDVTYPPLNYESTAFFGGNAVAHELGYCSPTGGPGYLDGYLAEVNFIDGQSLNPGLFGEYDNETGRWVPKKYNGSYGNNGFYLPFNETDSLTNLGRDFSGGYNLCGYSEQINDWPTKDQTTVIANDTTAPGGTLTADRITSSGTGPAYVRYDTAAVPINTIWTISAYVKAGNTSIVTLSDGYGTGAWAKFDLSTGSLISKFNPFGYQTAKITESSGGWYIIENSFQTNSSASYPIGIRLDVGRGYGESGTVGQYIWAWGGLVNLGKTRDLYTAVNTGTGTNKNWTPSGVSLTSGINYDSLVDSPSTSGTDNGAGGEFSATYCTLNPLYTQYTRFTDATVINGTTISAGGLRVSSTGAVNIIPGTIGVKSGKWYFEYKPTSISGGADMIGWTKEEVNKINGYRSNGQIYNNGTVVQTLGTWTSADTIGCAFDADLATMSFYKNGSLVTTINMTGAIDNFYYPVLWLRDTCSGDVNFGQRTFSYPAPSGYKVLCRENLPEPTIRNPRLYFTPKLYTGNETSQTFTTGFQTDLVWIKARNSGITGAFHDSARVNRPLSSTTSDAIESAGGSWVSNFSSTGFTVNNNTSGNGLNISYGSLAWNKSPTAGLDIVTYSGNNVSGRAISHNLGKVPKFIIVKSRNTAGDWAVWHSNLSSATHDIRLNSSAAQVQGYQFGTAPTSSAFYVGGSGSLTNSSGTDYVAYIFTEIDGLSSFGGYIGAGSLTTSPFIYTGFSPSLVMVKNISAAAHWIVYDRHKDVDNTAGRRVALNLLDSENLDNANLGFLDLVTGIDMLSNGFKVRTLGANHNGSGNSYIYMAFADASFKYANPR